MVRIFKIIKFNKWMVKNKIADQILKNIVDEISKGLINVDFGNGLIKQRAALDRKGKRGGIRVLVATNKMDCWIFLKGFKKNEVDNITKEEQALLQELCLDYLSLTDEQLNYMVKNGDFMEVLHDEQNST